MEDGPAEDGRKTYQPTDKPAPTRPQFRPMSAPRTTRSVEEPDLRPTSAPGVGRGAGPAGPLVGNWDGADGRGSALSGISEIALVEGSVDLAQRPTSAPARRILAGAATTRPASQRRRLREERLKDGSGALRYLDDSSLVPPKRIYSPLTSPQTNMTRFQPTWALSNHRQREREAIAETTLSSALDERSRPGTSGSRRGDSVNSSVVSRGGSRPGSSAGRSVRSARDGARHFSVATGPFVDIPRGAIKNPLAQKIGGSTGDLAEYNGSFEPLASQSRIPTYEALYDPHLKGFWSRNNVSRALKLEGKTPWVEPWAPDSGMLETAISAELADLYRNKDYAQVTEAPAPLVNWRSLGLPPPTPGALPGQPTADVMTIEASEEAVSMAPETVPLSLKQPIVSAWLHWGCQPGQESHADLDLSAVCFDSKARVVETIFYRHLVSKHEAIVHLGDDSDDTISPAEIISKPHTQQQFDMAASTRRKEGIIVHLPRVQANVVAIGFAVTCYTDEMGLAEAAGAEMRISVGPSRDAGHDDDILCYLLSSNRYKAASPCMLIRDARAESGWSVQTRPRVCAANVVVEMVPVMQAMLRQTPVCSPYVLDIEYCTARRPTTSLRGKRSDYTNSFKAVALAVRRSFPFVIVRGNTMEPTERPRVGAFELSFQDPDRKRPVLIYSKIQEGKWPSRMDLVLRRIADAMAQVQVNYRLPDDRSEVEVSVVDALSGRPVPWAVVEINALGLAAQKLLMRERERGGEREGRKGKRKKKTGEEAAGKRLYRVQTNGEGGLRMCLPGGRYEVWGLSQGFDCEYPLEMHVRPFSKFKSNARLALRRLDGPDEDQREAGTNRAGRHTTADSDAGASVIAAEATATVETTAEGHRTV